jgi:preprotein translocase subunit SecG
MLALLILDGLLMSVIILLQAGKGGGLAAMGGSGGTMADQLIGGRQAATLLTKATWTTGGIFIALSLMLSVLSTRSQTPGSILQEQFRQQPAPSQPVLPGRGTGPAATTPLPTTTPPATPPTTPSNSPTGQRPTGGRGN